MSINSQKYPVTLKWVRNGSEKFKGTVSIPNAAGRIRYSVFAASH
jgi:hypothetical protein